MPPDPAIDGVGSTPRDRIGNQMVFSIHEEAYLAWTNAAFGAWNIFWFHQNAWLRKNPTRLYYAGVLILMLL